MAATIGKLFFGGGAVFLGYKFGNSTIDSFTQKSRYTEKNIHERMRLKPGGKLEERKKMIEGLTSEMLDVLIIGGNLKTSHVALDSASRGLKTGLVDSEDFNSKIEFGLRRAGCIGSLPKIIDRFKKDNIDIMEKFLG